MRDSAHPFAQSIHKNLDNLTIKVTENRYITTLKSCTGYYSIFVTIFLESSQIQPMASMKNAQQALKIAADSNQGPKLNP